MAIIGKNNIKKIFKFIGDTHRQINNNYNEVVEIKALRRDKGNATAYRSFIYYNENEAELTNLTRQVEELNKEGVPFCMYYSVFTFDSSNVKKINLTNSVSTTILVSDYDHINEADFNKVLDKLKNIGLEPNYTIFSGHGYQTIYILKEPCYDKTILNKFTRLLLKKGFPVDENIKDSARVMRLPYTWNSKNIDNPIATDIYSYKEGSYDLEQIFTTLENQLETIPGYREERTIPVIDSRKAEDLTYYDTALLKRVYKYEPIDIDLLPAPIKAMLMGFRPGKTDNMIKCLVLYFRDYVGLTMEQTLHILNTLAGFNLYHYDGDVIDDIERKTKALYNKDYKLNFKDVMEFGKIKNIVKDRSFIEINNYLFDKEVSNIAYVIYLRLLLKKHYDHVISFTMEEIAELCNKSARRIKPRIDELIKAKLIDKARSDKKNGGQYRYTISKFNIDKTKGYTRINTTVLGLFIRELDAGVINETVLKFLLLMKSIANGSETPGEGVIVYQTWIAKKLNITQTAVSKLWDKVEKLGHPYPYITREIDGWILKPGDKFNYIYEVHF